MGQVEIAISHMDELFDRGGCCVHQTWHFLDLLDLHLNLVSLSLLETEYEESTGVSGVNICHLGNNSV